MPLHLELDSTISSNKILSRYVSHFISEFQGRLSGGPALNVDYSFHKDRAGFLPEGVAETLWPVYTQIDDLRVHIHLCPQGLIGIPALALQGWIDLELASYVLNFRPDLLQCNFRREILPLINVSGMAVQVMRYLVSHLETTLKQAMAIQMVLDMNHESPLFCYYYFKTRPSEEDESSYRHLVPHHWTRAIFICKKTRDHTAVTLLARNGFFAEVKSYWWNCHDYILPEDRRLMEELAGICYEFMPIRFSEQLVAMFKTVKSYLLE